MTDDVIAKAAAKLQDLLGSDTTEDECDYFARVLADEGLLADPELIADAERIAQRDWNQAVRATADRDRLAVENRHLRRDWYILTHLIGCIEDDPVDEVMDRARKLVAERDEFERKYEELLGQRDQWWDHVGRERHKLTAERDQASTQAGSGEANDQASGEVGQS